MNANHHKLILGARFWVNATIVVIFFGSLFLRYWRLGQFNTLVFDEVYYAVFGNNYLTGTTFFNAHPPLSQYLIALGIWLGSHLPIDSHSVNGFTGSMLSTWSYRWLNALTGALIPVLVGAIASRLAPLCIYTVIAALVSALDGLLLVESRYALSNIYLLLFGLLGQLAVLWALTKPDSRRWRQLTLAGVCFGAAAAVKWNGLGFLLGIYLVWIFAWLAHWLGISKDLRTPLTTPLSKIRQLSIFPMGWYLGIIPTLTYSLSWLPHLWMNPQFGFWSIHQQILTFHQGLGGNDIHPYCSSWYSWLIMGRPIAYFFQTARNTSEIVPAYPPLPRGAGKVIYAVHAMGNPVSWWLSTGAICLFAVVLVLGLLHQGRKKFVAKNQTWIVLYLVCNYAANLLPWLKVSRCTFIYHYMGALIFAQLALALILARWLAGRKLWYQLTAILVIGLIIAAFIFWLPIYLGLPLSPQGYQLRMLFSNWI